MAATERDGGFPSIPAITVWQPSAAEMCLPYLSGVLHGDGWCTPLSIGLRVKDRDFADSFASCLSVACGISCRARQDERGYWLVRARNARGRFSHLRRFIPSDNDDLTWWLRGLFDSEGNAQFSRAKNGPNSYSRRVAIYSTDRATLERASEYLMWLGVPNLIRATKNSASHKGSKAVHELRMLRREGFERFRQMVGSNIARKREALDRIVETYQPPGWQGRNWNKAVEARWGASR